MGFHLPTYDARLRKIGSPCLLAPPPVSMPMRFLTISAH
jgi:hypothetical protein